MTMIEPRFEWAVQVMLSAANGIDGTYALGVCDACRFLSGNEYSDAFNTVHAAYLNLLPAAVMARTDLPSGVAR